MNQQEFDEWKDDFFVQYPSVWEWLLKNSPEPRKTLAVWFESLESYSLAECQQVLKDWRQSGAKAFEAYDRDNIPVVVRSTIERKRQKAAEQERTATERYYRKQGRGEGIVKRLEGLGLRKAFERLRPFHKKLLDGELSPSEYEAAKSSILGEV